MITDGSGSAAEVKEVTWSGPQLKSLDALVGKLEASVTSMEAILGECGDDMRKAQHRPAIQQLEMAAASVHTRLEETRALRERPDPVMLKTTKECANAALAFAKAAIAPMHRALKSMPAA